MFEEEKAEIFQEPVKMDDTKEIRPSTHSKTGVHIKSQRLWLHVQGLSWPDGFQQQQRKWTYLSHPNQTQKGCQSPIDNSLQMKNYSNEVSLGIQSILKGRTHAH